jgi:hypothetical protein
MLCRSVIQACHFLVREFPFLSLLPPSSCSGVFLRLAGAFFSIILKLVCKKGVGAFAI